jgi:hypothetical protein
VAEALARFDDGTPPPSLQEIIRVAAAEEVRRQLTELRAQLAALAPRAPEAETPPERFDPFQAPAEPYEPAPVSLVVERVQANVDERRRRQPRGRPSVTTDGRTIDWRAVKKLYQRNRSLKQTAAAFNLSPNTVKARARKEGWAQ